MIKVNAVHPAFDLSMELLCLLPRADRKEDGAPFTGLVDDLGMRRPTELVIHFHILSRKYELEKYSYKKVKRMAVAAAGWDVAHSDAQAYYKQVYGA